MMAVLQRLFAQHSLKPIDRTIRAAEKVGELAERAANDQPVRQEDIERTRKLLEAGRFRPRDLIDPR